MLDEISKPEVQQLSRISLGRKEVKAFHKKKDLFQSFMKIKDSPIVA